MFVSHSQLLILKWRLLVAALSIIAMPMSASAQTASDLFEKAVYADETAGDLDKAIKLYGQVIAKAKTASSIGAEAQHRLGLCFEKLGEKEKAREAFQAVVDDFPNEAKFVALAKKRLPGALKLLPIPWKDDQQLYFTMKLASGMEIGTEVSSIHATQLNGKPVWRCSNRIFATINGANSFSEAFCDKETFAPLQSYWTHSMLGSAEASYAEDNVTINITGRDEPLVLDFTVPGYDNEQGIQAFRRLPLEVGMSSAMTIIATLTGNVVPLEFEVPKKETITTATGTFDCYKMVLNIGQTFWISDDAQRYLVRFEAGGVIADLTRIEQRKLDESFELDDDQINITLPAGWFTYVEDNDEDDGDHDVYLLDPRAISKGKIRVADKDPQDDGQKSPQTWVDSSLKKIRRKAKGFKLRGEGISEIKIDGKEAAQVVFDFEEKMKPMTGYAMAVFSEKSAATIQFIVPSDQFESMRGEFDQLIHSLKLK